MAEYISSLRDWVREQVELYERANGAEGNTLRDTGLPVVIVTNIGNRTGAIRKTPLMRVKDGAKSRTPRSAIGFGRLPWQPIRRMRSTRPGPLGEFRCSWPSRPGDRIAGCECRLLAVVRPDPS